MKVLIATKNKAKIEGARRAFEKIFKQVEIEGVSVSSDVSEQPINQETLQGAKNRVENLKRFALDNDISDIEFFVSIESGLVDVYGNWMIVNFAVVENKSGLISVSTSPAFPVPERLIGKIKNVGLGDVMDEIFGEKDLHVKGGGIQLLTGGVVSRIDLTELAFVMALTKFVNGENWR